MHGTKLGRMHLWSCGHGSMEAPVDAFRKAPRHACARIQAYARFRILLLHAYSRAVLSM